MEASGQVALDYAADQQRPDNDRAAGSEGSDLALSGGWSSVLVAAMALTSLCRRSSTAAR